MSLSNDILSHSRLLTNIMKQQFLHGSSSGALAQAEGFLNCTQSWTLCNSFFLSLKQQQQLLYLAILAWL
jgi:hypothetical protein